MSKGPIERREFLRVSAVAGMAAMGGALNIEQALARRDRHLWGAYVDQRSGQDAHRSITAFESMIDRRLDVTRHYTDSRGRYRSSSRSVNVEGSA